MWASDFENKSPASKKLLLEFFLCLRDRIKDIFGGDIEELWIDGDTINITIGWDDYRGGYNYGREYKSYHNIPISIFMGPEHDLRDWMKQADQRKIDDDRRRKEELRKRQEEDTERAEKQMFATLKAKYGGINEEE